MPTITEIQKPHLTYCQKYDEHCLCPKCVVRQKNLCDRTCEICENNMLPPTEPTKGCNKRTIFNQVLRLS